MHTTLEVWPRMIHVWHWYARMLDEGQQAIERVAQFMHGALRQRAAADPA